MVVDRNNRSHRPAGLAKGVAGTFDENNRKGGDSDLTPPITTVSFGSEREACGELAKRRNIDLLWKTASIEVRGLTFPDTRDVFKGITPADARAKDIMILNNLKHAWQFLLDDTDWPVDWQYLSEYNRLVGEGIEPNPGSMRTDIVTIGGTEYVPAIPAHDGIRQQIETDLSHDDPEERALNLFASISRGQWFSNGNKRTSAMAANHCLIHDGIGVFALPPGTRRRRIQG
ncbi:Fic family protein [Bifidobacterium sp. SO1]|uniref:Fic family protein n=1 Tax=Bifidobacterium sp. SO1 TaxID=2809029 RepID=UPI001BDC8E77|nr:Fic family protein [Bifidobacterium sp. SO1]MBT1162781.1 Fic family protein [Bifidobacterium sp. SO1]